MIKKTSITLVLFFIIADFAGVLFAGQSARQYTVGYLNAQRSLTPDEMQLANYLMQRSQILKDLSKSKTPYVLRNKLKVLNGKITYLENRVKKNRKSTQATVKHSSASGLPSSSKKTTVHQKPAVKKLNTAVKPKTAHTPETPKIQEVSTPIVTENETLPPLTLLKQPAAAANHEVYRFEDPSNAPVFKQAELPSQQMTVVAPPDVSKTNREEPLTSAPISSTVSSDTQLSSAIALKPDVQTLSVKPAPAVSMATAKIEKIDPVTLPKISDANISSLQNASNGASPSVANLMPKSVELQKADQVVSVAPQTKSSQITAVYNESVAALPANTIPKTAELQKTDQTVSVSSLNPQTVSPQIASAPIENLPKTVVSNEPAETDMPVQTQQPVALKGTDWVGMSDEEKEMYVFSAMGALVKHDVVSMKPSSFYIQTLDETLTKEPSKKEQYLDDLFISNIYQNEPDTRLAINKIRR